VRQPGVTLLVDGYNVSQRAWGELSVSEQRRRLVDALEELAARAGADVRVVFDGAAEPMASQSPAAPRAVKVSFSPPGVEADDVIVNLVPSMASSRAVVVASSDNRVREAATRAGANVISAGQLLAVVGRGEARR
jgi:predicted RNA-binding protein with PIN domain